MNFYLPPDSDHTRRLDPISARSVLKQLQKGWVTHAAHGIVELASRWASESVSNTDLERESDGKSRKYGGKSTEDQGEGRA